MQRKNSYSQVIIVRCNYLQPNAYAACSLFRLSRSVQHVSMTFLVDIVTCAVCVLVLLRAHSTLLLMCL
jgi:hypothetical protein